MLAQVVVSAAHIARASTTCGCAALTSEPLRQLFHGAFVMLNSLTTLLLLPSTPCIAALEGTPPAGQCAAVLSYLQLSLGLVAPALAQAALEARLFSQHEAERQCRGLPPERGAHARLYRRILQVGHAAPEELLIVAAAWLGVCLLWIMALAIS